MSRRSRDGHPLGVDGEESGHPGLAVPEALGEIPVVADEANRLRRALHVSEEREAVDAADVGLEVEEARELARKEEVAKAGVDLVPAPIVNNPQDNRNRIIRFLDDCMLAIFGRR